MKHPLFLVAAASAALILAFGACNDAERNELTQGGPGGQPPEPDPVGEACTRICEASNALGCSTDALECEGFSCDLRKYEKYAPWCELEWTRLSECIVEMPDDQFICANGVAIVDASDFMQPCATERNALRACLWEGSSAFPQNFTAECQQRCDLYAGLVCAPADCLADCSLALDNSSECNAISASVLLCVLDNNPMGVCETDQMGTTEAKIVPTPATACLVLDESKFQCEFDF